MLASSPKESYNYADDTLIPSHSLLDVLPVEITIQILQRLSCREILRCSLACKALRTIIQVSVEIQYKIELDVDGLEDGLPSQMSTKERLELLLDRRRRWRKLDWVERVTVPSPRLSHAYELVGGVYAKGAPFGETNGSHVFSATWLPSRMQAMRKVERDDVGVSMRDFALDPSQDLVAFFAVPDPSANGRLLAQVALRKLSTNEPYPGVARKVLRVLLPPFLPGHAVIQIVDDVIGVFSLSEERGLVIWHWRSARVLVHRVGNEFPESVCDFAFLSSRAYVLTTTMDPGTVEVYTFEDHAEPPEHEPAPPAHVATLQLPPLAEDSMLMFFTTHTGPFVCNPIPGKPFHVSRDSYVHMMSMDYLAERSYHMIVHNRFLLSFVPRDGVKLHSKVELTWKEWGPTNTRIIRRTGSYQLLRYVHGARIILPPTRQASGQLMQVLDFNVHSRRVNDPAAVQDTPDNDLVYDLDEGSSTARAGDIFQHDVVTSLPFSTTTRRVQGRHSGFMIDDERIVGTKSGFFMYPSNDIDVFIF
ncbi:uncharacterized protein LAESUDRAFT_699525 [Laetiporus sulphureus 93-53]|uniref:F-box domain-containing protein n=1 Tax=Laetiporus sulphureus 93-53 TaxID=1314785 RepID=A0A165EIG8_9APHY|nr:uncharacterized protein LAESUDRAFT_699525 [Laetiporus sulphureus 93-53]KZT07120.1 hypothetical protein LAESUDRAFT_699525 [Laetiporus sulphureus 93-53]